MLVLRPTMPCWPSSKGRRGQQECKMLRVGNALVSLVPGKSTGGLVVLDGR